MSDLRALAHLEEQLGPARWRAAIDSKNTGKLRDFCECELGAMPTEFTVGDRTYKHRPFLRDDDVSKSIVAAAAHELNGSVSDDDCEYLRVHQTKIPEILRGQVVFVFVDSNGKVYYFGWDRNCWREGTDWFLEGSYGYRSILHRVS